MVVAISGGGAWRLCFAYEDDEFIELGANADA